MTAWVTLPDSDLDPDSPITTSLMIALRDNPIAISEGAAGAPEVKHAALEDHTASAPKYQVGSVGGASTTSTGYTKVAEMRIGSAGTIRVDFRLSIANAASTAFGRIYRNGVAVGTERSTTSTSLVTFTEAIAGWSRNDLIQLYVRTSNASHAATGQTLTANVDSAPVIGTALP